MTAHVGGDQRRAAEALERMWELCVRHGMRLFAGNGLQMLSTIYTEHLGDPKKGLAFASECLKIAPHYANAHFAAGKAHAALGDQEKAREMFLAAADDAKFLDRQYVVDEDACGWKAFCEIAGTYTAQGDNVTALEWLDRALTVRPDVRIARLRRAITLEALGRLDEAASDYDAMHVTFNDEQSALALVNFLLRHDGRKAIEAIEREYRNLPVETAVAMLLAATALSQRNGWSDGEKHLLCAAELAPGSAEVLAPLEELYRARGDEAAIARLREAENAVAPRTAADFARRAQIAISLNDFTRAYELARTGLSSAPQDAVLHYNAAIAAVNLGAREEALAHLESIESAPGQVFVQAEYLRAVLLREMQRYDDALEALTRMLSVSGPQTDALLLRGSILDLAGRKEEAEASFREALPLAKKRAAIELAAFYLREGRPADAQRVADEALA
jgi:tetratricopeptide (TPR) repeat protein